MSLNPLAPPFLPHYQCSSDPPISLGHSNTMNLPLAQLICGVPPQTIPSLASSTNQHLTDGTFLLPFLQPTNLSKPDAAFHQPTPSSIALLPSSLQHQAKCLQTNHKTFQQFNQHLKEEQLDRQTDLTTHCPSTAESLCFIALLALLPGWTNLQQGYYRQNLRYQSSI